MLALPPARTTHPFGRRAHCSGPRAAESAPSDSSACLAVVRCSLLSPVPPRHLGWAGLAGPASRARALASPLAPLLTCPARSPWFDLMEAHFFFRECRKSIVKSKHHHDDFLDGGHFRDAYASVNCLFLYKQPAEPISSITVIRGTCRHPGASSIIRRRRGLVLPPRWAQTG